MSVVVRRASVVDAEALTRHFADPGVYGGLLQLPYPSLELWSKRLAEQSSASNGDVLLVAERDRQLLGHVGLNTASLSPRRRHAMGLGIAVSSDAQGKGVGATLMDAICEYADRWLGIVRIELTVYTDNERALRLYRRFGFEIEGTLRAFALRDGRYVDALTMARLHPQPPALTLPG